MPATMRRNGGLLGRGAAGAAAAVLAMAVLARAQDCDVNSDGNSVELLSRDTFVESEMDVKALSSIDSDGNLVLLDSLSGTASQAWFEDQLRMGDGFKATFDFSSTDYVDGLAFVVQNNRTINTMTGTNSNLGYIGGFNKYLGINIETCSNFDSPCEDPLIKVWTRTSDGTDTEVGSTSAGDISYDLTDGTVYRVAATYSAYNGEVVVEIGPASGTLESLLTVAVGDLESILESRFAYVGFSASVTDSITSGELKVDNLDIVALPSNTYISSDLGESIDWGRSYIFTLALRDDCGAQISFDALGENETYSDTVWANLTNVDYVTENNLEDESDYTLGVDYYNPASLTLNDDGAIDIRFDLPFRVSATWRLSVEYMGVATAAMPLEDALKTHEPSAGTALPTWGLALLIVLIVLIIIGLIYAVWRLKRYRDKLRQNEENIEAGKEKAKLDALDHEVEYSVNPMLGTPEEMKRKLAENERELERLRSGKNSTYDDASTIAELQRQNAELREEMNKLKREAQQEEALQSSYTPAVQAPAKTDRKQYGQGRA